MSTVILLTAAQAAQVQGPSDVDPNASLRPVPLSDGRYILGVEVLADPAHVAHKAVLQALAQADYSTVASLVQGHP